MKEKQLGWSKEEIRYLQNKDKKIRTATNYVSNTYHSIEKMALFVLYDKLGYTIDQLEEYEKNIQGLLVLYAEKEINLESVRKAVGNYIDIEKEVQIMPWRCKMTLARHKKPKGRVSMAEVIKLVNDAYSTIIAFTTFSVSLVSGGETIAKFMEAVKGYMESYVNGYLTDKDIDELLEVIEEETGYKSLAGGKNGATGKVVEEVRSGEHLQQTLQAFN